MGVKQNTVTKRWKAFVVIRHPITKKPQVITRQGIQTEEEARRIEVEIREKLKDRLAYDSLPYWNRVVECFLQDMRDRGLTEKTIHDYKCLLKVCTEKRWDKQLLDLITTQEIRELVLKDMAEHSAAHQKNILKAIRAVFLYAIEEGIIERNPIPRIKFRLGDKLKRVLTQEQVRVFLTRAKELNWEWYPICATALYTGMRNGELYALTWDKVNLDDRLIKVDQAWNQYDGIKSTKSGDDRMVEIPGPLLHIFKELRLRSGDSPFVLPRLERWTTASQAAELRAFLNRIGLPSIRFHDLRATWATLLLSKGVEPIKVMKAGGWKDMKTMMIYVRKAGVDIRGMSDCLDLHNPTHEIGQILQLKTGPV